MAKRRTAPTPPPAGRARKARPVSQVSAVPRVASVPSGVPSQMAGDAYDDQTGLQMPLVGQSADPGRFPDFPTFGQLSRSGLLSVGGLVGNGRDPGAMRVFNPERISLGELDEMSLDPVIRACLLGYTLILQTAGLSVSCPDASMKALVESQFLPLMPQLIRETVRPAMVFGWADAEVVWETRYDVAVEVDPGETRQSGTPGPDDDPGDSPVRVFPYVTAVRDFVPLNNTTLTLRQTVQGEFAGAVQWGWGEVFLPPAQLFHLPLSAMFRNPYGESSIKACYPFWYWTRFLYEMLMVGTERTFAPPIVGRYPVGQKINVGRNENGTEAQVDAGDYMLQQLAQLRSFSTAVFPRLLNKDGKDLYDILELTLTADMAGIMAAIAALNGQKQLAMFFPDKLLQGGDVGSYALAKEHTDLFSLAVQAKLDEILGRVNDGPLARFVRYNDPRCPPARLTYSAPNVQAMLALSTAVVQAITTGQALVTQNQDKILVPDWKALADQFGIPYTIVRRMDGMDALGNPLQPGVNPDQQDRQAAQAAGLAPQGGYGGGYQSSDVPRGPGAPGGGAPPASASGESADQFLSRTLGVAPKPPSKAALWEGEDTDAVVFSLALSDADFAAGAREHEEGREKDRAYSHLVLSLRGLDLGDGDRVALAQAKHTGKQVDMMQHLYANGPTSYGDLKTALPHIVWPHQVGGDLAAKGLLQKVKHPQSGAAAFEITDAGKAALAQHLGWPGPSQAAPAAPPPGLKNSEANALHGLMTTGPQSAAGLLGAKALHSNWPAGSNDLTSLHQAGHIAPTGAADAKGEPQYAITASGGQALAEHMGSQTAAAPAQAAPGAPASPAPPAPAAATAPSLSPAHLAILQAAHDKKADGGADFDDLLDAHHQATGGFTGGSAATNDLIQSGHMDMDAMSTKPYTITPLGREALAAHKGGSGGKAPNAGQHKVSGGSDKDPNEPYHFEPGQAVDDQNMAAAVLHHVAAHGDATTHGVGKYEMGNALNFDPGKYDDAFNAALGDLKAKGHITEQGPLGGGFFKATDQGKAALQAGAAQAQQVTPAGTQAAPPEGWKPISTKSDKGYKTTHEGKTAVVKPGAGGQWQLATTDGRDIEIHPTPFATKEEAFGEGEKQIGKPPPVTLPQGWAQEEDGAGNPFYKLPGSDPNLPQASAFLDNGKWNSAVYHGVGTGVPTDYAEHGSAQEAVDAAHAGAQAAAKAAQTPNPPAAWDSVTDPADGSVQHVKKDVTGQKHTVELHQTSGKWLTIGPKYTDKFDTPAEAFSHAEAKIAAVKPAKPKKTKAAQPPQAAPATPAAPATAAAAPDHVTLFGKKQELSDEPTTQAEIDALKSDPAANLSDKAKTVMDAAYKAGKLATHGDLHQALAVGEAVNKTGAYTHMTGFSLQHGIDTGGVKKLKEKAEAGDAAAQTYAAHLGDTSILTDKEKAAQAQQQAQDAFHKSGVSDLLHIKTGGAQGSNDGGFYTTKSGQKIYAKEYKNPDQAHSEHLANAIYGALGVHAPTSTVASDGGKTVYASQLIDNKGTLGKAGLTKDNATEALGGFAADVLLGNWDAAGTGHDNMVVGADGKIHRIDNGGALLYRAQGGKKDAAYLHGIREWDKYSSPSSNPYYSQLFSKAGIASGDEIKGVSGQIKAIEDLAAQPGGWKAFVDQHAPGMSDGDKKAVVGMLDARTKLLADKRKALLGPHEAVKAQYTPHKTHQEGAAWTDKEFGEQGQKATDAESKAAAWWKGGGSWKSTNSLLYKGMHGQAGAAEKGHIAALDKLFDKPTSKTKSKVILTREFGLDKPDEVDLKNKYSALQPGDEVHVRGYQAASFGDSTNPAPSSGYAASHGFVWRIHVPEGTGLVHVDGVIGKGAKAEPHGERELLVNRGAQYRVLSTQKVGGKIVQDVELIGYKH